MDYITTRGYDKQTEFKSFGGWHNLPMSLIVKAVMLALCRPPSYEE